jgi:hypothetical protein
MEKLLLDGGVKRLRFLSQEKSWRELSSYEEYEFKQLWEFASEELKAELTNLIRSTYAGGD